MVAQRYVAAVWTLLTVCEETTPLTAYRAQKQATA